MDAQEVSDAPVNVEAPVVVAEAEVEAEVAAPEVVAEVAAQPDYQAQIASLTGQLADANRTARIGLGAAVIAVLVAGALPWWAPRALDNDSATRQSAVLAAVQMRQLASHEEPFDAELALLAKAMPQDSATKATVAAIMPLAKDGVPTVASLKELFRGTADRVLAGKVVAQDEQSWVSWGIYKVAALMRVDTLASTVMQPTEDLQVVHEADAALAEGNLAGAVQLVGKLDGASADIVQAWLPLAKKRLALDAAVVQLGQQAEKRSSQAAWLR
ncbi:MAG: hypothetical protein K2X44_06440 [Magnetospirillum sp.]|nr:hypothetical protein [Magnetospirillum sp.]